MYRTNISFCLYQSNNTKLEQENEHLNKILSSASEEKERIKSMHERELEVSSRHLQNKLASLIDSSTFSARFRCSSNVCDRIGNFFLKLWILMRIDQLTEMVKQYRYNQLNLHLCNK